MRAGVGVRFGRLEIGRKNIRRAVNEADDAEFPIDPITRARVAKVGRRSRSDSADVLCWQTTTRSPCGVQALHGREHLARAWMSVLQVADGSLEGQSRDVAEEPEVVATIRVL